MSDNSDETNKSQKVAGEKKQLGFWRFGEDAKIDVQSPFPKNEILSSKEMHRVNEKLYNRLLKYKNSSCFNYLQGYYDFYTKAYNSKTEYEVIEHSNNATSSLKLFTLCHEKEKELNFTKQ